MAAIMPFQAIKVAKIRSARQAAYSSADDDYYYHRHHHCYCYCVADASFVAGHRDQETYPGRHWDFPRRQQVPDRKVDFLAPTGFPAQ
jgi:hypothetical protein